MKYKYVIGLALAISFGTACTYDTNGTKNESSETDLEADTITKGDDSLQSNTEIIGDTLTTGQKDQ